MEGVSIRRKVCGWQTITVCQLLQQPQGFGFPALQPMTYMGQHALKRQMAGFSDNMLKRVGVSGMKAEGHPQGFIVFYFDILCIYLFISYFPWLSGLILCPSDNPGSIMELITLPPSAPPALPSSASWIWGLVWLWARVVASGLLTFLLIVRGAKGCLNFFAQDSMNRAADQPKRWAAQVPQGSFQSRFPQEEVDLATFVTRRPSAWRGHQPAGRDCFLILD